MDIKLIVNPIPFKSQVIINNEAVPCTRAVLTLTATNQPCLTVDIPIQKTMKVEGNVKLSIAGVPVNDEIGRQVYEQLKERYDK